VRAHVVAFARTTKDRALFVAVARHCAEPCMAAGRPLPDKAFWADGVIMLDEHLRSRTWHDALANEFPETRTFDCASLFARFPVAVLVSGIESP
jgi:maltooligosyltrehalose synthase